METCEQVGQWESMQSNVFVVIRLDVKHEHRTSTHTLTTVNLAISYIPNIHITQASLPSLEADLGMFLHV